MSYLGQDMPPRGGFPPLNVSQDRFPVKGISANKLFLVCTALVTYGLAKWWYIEKEEKKVRLARQSERDAFLEKVQVHVDKTNAAREAAREQWLQDQANALKARLAAPKTE